MELKEKSGEQYNTMSLQKVKEMLNFKGKGFRSVLRWCNKKGITVFGSGRRKRILENDWKQVQRNELASAIKLQYPNNWVKELKKRGLKVIDLSVVKTTYQARSKDAQKLLKDWGE